LPTDISLKRFSWLVETGRQLLALFVLCLFLILSI